MKNILKKLLEIFSSEEALKELSVDEIEGFLKEVKHKKLEYLNFKNVKLQETKAEDGSLRLVAIASTESVDRGGDVVIVKGIRTPNIKGSIPMFIQHDPDLQVGGWDKWYVNDKNEFIVEGTFFPPVLDWQKSNYELVKAGVMNGISIGYYPEKFSFDDVAGTRILEEIELVEVSIVTIPMNQDATILSVDELKKSQGLPTKSATADDPGAKPQDVSSPELEAQEPAPSEEPDMAKIKEEIETLKARNAELETEVNDYETLLEESNNVLKELMTQKGVIYAPKT